MKLYEYEHQEAWTDAMAHDCRPSVTLRSGLAGTRSGLPYVKDFLKLGARSLAHREQTRRWLGLLNSHPAFSELVRHCPRLVHKIYRPYLTNTLRCEDRLQVLASHYRFIFRRNLGATVVQASRAGVWLGSATGKTGTVYALHLHAVGTLEREGELVLQLSADGALLYSVAFTFSTSAGSAAVSIGCIQGPKTGDGLTAIRHATRELHGLRPKQLLVTLVRHLGHQLGCTQLRLVGNDNRVVRNAMRKGRVAADYDTLWGELGAARLNDGDFLMACGPLQMPDMEQVQSKKRSEVRKRHELITGLLQSAALRLGVPAEPEDSVRADALLENYRAVA